MNAKYFWITLLLVTCLAVAAGAIAFNASSDASVRTAAAKGDAMEWLRTDFHLTDAQYERVKALHDGYSVECEDHCRAIQEAVRERKELQARAQGDAAALAAADARVQSLRAVCENAIAGHVRRCAAEMSPEAGRRYLALVLPKVADFDHQAPPDLQMNHRHVH